MRGSLGELALAAGTGAAAIEGGGIPARGEFAIVVGDWRGGRPADAADQQSLLASAQAEVEALVTAGLARGDAARRVASSTGLPRRSLYRADASRQDGPAPSQGKASR